MFVFVVEWSPELNKNVEAGPSWSWRRLYLWIYAAEVEMGVNLRAHTWGAAFRASPTSSGSTCLSRLLLLGCTSTPWHNYLSTGMHTPFVVRVKCIVLTMRSPRLFTCFHLVPQKVISLQSGSKGRCVVFKCSKCCRKYMKMFILCNRRGDCVGSRELITMYRIVCYCIYVIV